MNEHIRVPNQLTPDEKRSLLARLLRERGQTKAPPGLVHHWFEAQAARSPNAVAVSCGDHRLTYNELNRRANRVAHRLRALGVGPEVLVGLCTSRSVEMVVGLLGVLKASGAYVPLDPDYPRQRLAFMLSDSDAKVLLTEQSLAEKLPENHAELLCLDSAHAELERESPENPTASPFPANLAYVIYTSGSTGRPKGVQISHGALANFIRSMSRLLGLTERDTLLAVTTLSFDIAGLEVYLPLVVGARIELVSRDVATDGTQLVQHLAASGASFLQATPATWRLLLESSWPGDPGLTMLCGGETLPRALAERLIPKGRCLWNLYGPTETTIWSTAGRVESREGPVPIGLPISATQLYVLDRRLRPVPVGVTGELYIAGAGLARGYLNLPALSADRFLPNPLAKSSGQRIYRTGDLARWRSDGSLECLGRIDHQVKIRGYRIELGEIEAALLDHPSVREAAVAAQEPAPGEKRLVAYVVGRDGLGPVASELRQWLIERLPEYMVPAQVVELASLPLTPNGKIDRGALPAPDANAILSPGSYIPPRDPMEEALAGIWLEVLGCGRVGVQDNFFDLGGHSLLAAQVHARIRDSFAVEVPLRDLFDAVTVAGQARLVEQAMRSGTFEQAPPLERVPRDGHLSASFAQERLWFLDQLDPGNSSYNLPAVVRLTGALDTTILERSLGEVVRRHEALRTRFAAIDGQPVQVIAPEATIPLLIEDLTSVPEADRAAEALRRARDEGRRPFDLARGPLLRARLWRLGPLDHIVAITMHHIVSDGWSMGILIRELGQLYSSLSTGHQSPFSALPIQYADFAAWQRRWLEGGVLKHQLEYWKTEMAGVPVLDLPTDRPRTSVMSNRGADWPFDLSKPLVDAVRALGRQEEATLFMTLCAAFEVLLHRYSGQDDFAIGMPIAGRGRLEVEGLIGFFVNTLVLRCDLSGEPSFREVLRRVRLASLRAYAHQDVPFDQLVGTLQTGRDPSRTPLFQVMLSMQNAPLPSLEAPGLSMQPITIGSGAAKFDLTLFLSETETGLHGSVEYNVDLFDAGTVERMFGHFQNLIASITTDPEQPIGALPLMSAAERQQLFARGDEPEIDEGSVSLDGLSDEEMELLSMPRTFDVGVGDE
jgi:amino acid adenylation domain-containing protein